MDMLVLCYVTPTRPLAWTLCTETVSCASPIGGQADCISSNRNLELNRRLTHESVRDEVGEVVEFKVADHRVSTSRFHVQSAGDILIGLLAPPYRSANVILRSMAE